LITEDSVELNKGRAAPFIAPSVLPVLQAKLLDLTIVNGPPETRHEAKVEVTIIFVSCFVDQVEIAQDEPARTVWRFQLS
jgi:hypothetical protein